MAKYLSDLKPGQDAVISKLLCVGAVKRRLVDMGLTPGARVFMQKIAPLGDPIEIHIRGYALSIRLKEARKIQLE